MAMISSSSIDIDSKRFQNLNPPMPKYLRGNMWKGHRCFIVGGGSSLKSFDFSQLQGELTIGINKAFEKFDPTIIFSMDNRFLGWVELGELGVELQSKFINYSRGIKCWLDVVNMGYTDDIVALRCAGVDKWSERLSDGLGHGENSGYAALNLAYLLGANPIYLLGFDMYGNKDTGLQQWFHSGYPEVQSNQVYEKFRRYFETTAVPAIRASSTEVVNLNPDSGLNGFPKSPISSIHFSPELPVLCSYFTGDYLKRAVHLKETCKLFGLKTDFVQIGDLGGWQANTQYKSKFLIDMLTKHKEPVVWIDSDAEVNQFPSLFRHMSMFDFGAHHRGGTELLSGTCYFNFTHKSLELLHRWDYLNKLYPEELDQVNLANAVKLVQGLKSFELPASYCCIFDAEDMLAVEPVIVHNQASRETYWKDMLAVEPVIVPNQASRETYWKDIRQWLLTDG